MKSNAPSPRFLHEFDTLDTLAMRNISEKRKLQERLREFDKQLHSNLVRMESEILSIRLENSEPTPATLLAKRKNKENNNNVNKGKIVGDVKENSREKGAKSDSQKQERNWAMNSSQAIQTPSSHNTLPKITRTSYLTAKPEEFDESKDNDAKVSAKSSSLETISEMGQKRQQAEQRILMSLQRCQLKVQPETIGRPPTPQASSQLLSPFNPVDRQRRASSHGLLAPLSDEYVTKGRNNRALSAPDVSELLRSELGRLKGLPDVNGLETNGIKMCVTNENSRPKPEQKVGLKANLVKAHETGNRELKTPTFDDVMKRRLQLLENGVPKREELEMIRYLRLRDEHENTSDVGDIFVHLHQNNND